MPSSSTCSLSYLTAFSAEQFTKYDREQYQNTTRNFVIYTEFLPLCQARGISVLLAGVFNGGILASGAVAGAYYKYAPAYAAVLARVQHLEQICAQYQVPLAAAALQFPLAHPAVTALVIGAESPAEVRSFRAALSTSIPPACWEALRNAGALAEAAPVPTSPVL